MNRRLAHLSIIFVLMVSLGSCESTPQPPPPIVSPVAGFTAFASAGDFDPPGQIFRIDPDRVVWRVTTLEVAVQTGQEQTQSIETNSSMSLNGLIETIGAATAQFSVVPSAELRKSRSVSLGTVSGIREFVQDDSGILMAATEFFRSFNFREDNEYFLIRETISTRELNYRSSKDWLVALGVDATFRDVASANANLNWEDDQTFELVKSFDKPLRVWYKAEMLVPEFGLGVGPGASPKLRLEPLSADSFRIPDGNISVAP